MPEEGLVKIRGVVQSVVFRNEQNGFCVFELAVDEETEELVTVVGELSAVEVGESLCATGSYMSHPTYGRQFRALAVEQERPTTAQAILRYLSGGAVRGVGPALARRIVDAFGEDTLRVLEEEPASLSRIRGISPRMASEIGEAYGRVSSVRSAMLFLSGFGIGTAMSIAIWKRFGHETQSEVTRDPYQLCQEGIGLDFSEAEKIAGTLGIGADAPCRLRGGIRHVLGHNLQNGHACLPLDKLALAAAGLLDMSGEQIADEVEKMCDLDILASEHFDQKRYIYLPRYHAAECYAAGRLRMMLDLSGPEQNAPEEEIDALEAELDIRYAALQRRAIAAAVTGRLLILTGGPGTGKTTALNGIIRLCERRKLRVALAAPTGRAAKRISEITGREAVTVHRLLEVDFGDEEGYPKFRRNEKNPLPQDIVIVDEMSMVDLRLFEALIRAVRLGASLIMVGDPDQLPSVGAGNLLAELIGSGVIPTVHLSEVFRQAAQSRIVTAAHEIVAGELPDLSVRDSDLFFLPRVTPEQAALTVVELTGRRLPAAYGYDPMTDIQVITPTRQGVLGTGELGRRLQQALNPPSPQKVECPAAGGVFREGDKVMQIKNNYDIPWSRDDAEEGAGVFNGDIGRIELIDRPSRSVLVRFEDRVVQYGFDMLGELELAYAVTVHKSQGSEFEAVVMPLMGYHRRLHYRNLLYTGITRARRLLILVGQAQTVAYMVQNDRKARRYSNLAAMLREG